MIHPEEAAKTATLFSLGMARGRWEMPKHDNVYATSKKKKSD